MKSLFIVNDFPPILGGQSNYLYNLIRACPKNQIIVLAPYVPGCHAFDARQDFQIIRKRYLITVPVLEKICKIVIPLFHALRLCRQYQVKHIHCAHVLSTGFIGLILHALYRYPYYIYTYSADIMEYQKYPLVKRILQKILTRAQRVIAISDYNKQKLEELRVPESKITKIMPRIDIKKLEEKPNASLLKNMRQRYDLEGKKIILSVNRLVKRKGNDTLITALPTILNQIPDAIYLIVGDGPYREDLETMAAQHNVSQAVRFIRNATHADVHAFYHLCNVMIMLSREIRDKGDAEGFGIVFLEANACGKPVIGGRSGGIPDAVIHEKTGLLVDPESQEQIRKAAIRILTDSELANRLGQNGHHRVSAQFDWRQGLTPEHCTQLGLSSNQPTNDKDHH